MRLVICLTSGCGNLTDQPPRCDEHSQHRHAGPSRTPRTRYGAQWDRLSKQLRQEQPWCTRCGSDQDLTVDHIIPGSVEGGLMVLCRPCNSRKSGQDRKFRNAVDRL
jgi:5-methylcytosine-specific restriction endonuclease McrA